MLDEETLAAIIATSAHSDRPLTDDQISKLATALGIDAGGAKNLIDLHQTLKKGRQRDPMPWSVGP